MRNVDQHLQIFSYINQKRDNHRKWKHTDYKLAAKELAELIAYNTTRIQRVVDTENLIIAVLAKCGSSGKSNCLELLTKIRGGCYADSLIKPSIVKSIIDYKRLEFYRKSKIIIENLMEDHTNRRYTQACACTKKIAHPIIPNLISATTLNSSTIFGWTIFGLTLTGFSVFGALDLFHRSEKKRYQNNGTIIDVIA